MLMKIDILRLMNIIKVKKTKSSIRKDLKDIERDYRNHNIIYSYNNNVDFYEGDELVAAVNPSKVKK